MGKSHALKKHLAMKSKTRFWANGSWSLLGGIKNLLSPHLHPSPSMECHKFDDNSDIILSCLILDLIL